MQFADLAGQYQTNVDLTVYRGAGYDTLAHKVSEGVSYTDPRIGVRWQTARDLGMTRIGYHFLRGTPTADQAHHFLDVLNAAGGLQPTDLLALDYESNDASNQAAVIWLQTVRAAVPNQRLLIYSGDWFLRPRGLRYTDLPERVGYWMSAYVTQSQMLRYLTPGWPVPCAWQFTDKASIAGLGTVDCSQQLCDLTHLYPAAPPSGRFAGFRTLQTPTRDPLIGPLPNIAYAPSDFPVHALQFTFNLLYGTSLAWDGLYGAATATAAANFQRNSGLVADGIVGPVTWAALDAAARARGM